MADNLMFDDNVLAVRAVEPVYYVGMEVDVDSYSTLDI